MTFLVPPHGDDDGDEPLVNSDTSVAGSGHGGGGNGGIGSATGNDNDGEEDGSNRGDRRGVEALGSSTLTMKHTFCWYGCYENVPNLKSYVSRKTKIIPRHESVFFWMICYPELVRSC